MNSTIIHTLPTNSRKAAAKATIEAFRQPAYDCQEHANTMKLVVYVPGVAASGVEIEGRGADLTVTAKKARFVRVNFTALHLEGAQRDYRLRLRLGAGFDYAAMGAEIANGVLTVTLPKRALELDRSSTTEKTKQNHTSSPAPRAPDDRSRRVPKAA